MKYKEFEAKAKEWNGKTCIFGAGLSGRTWVYDMAVAAGFFVDFFCDNMYEKGILIVDELKTISLQELYNYGDNVLILLAIKEESQEQVVNQLVKNGITNIIKMGYFFLQDCYFEIEKASDEVKTRYRIIMDDAEFLKKRYDYLS